MIVLILLGAWYAFYFWRTVSVYPLYRYYNIAAKIEKDARVYDVKGQIACRHNAWPLLLLGIGSITIDGGSSYSATSYAVGFQFEDGEGILLRPDELNCGGKGHFEHVDQYAFPLVYWLNNARKPTRIEAYFVPSYYQQRDARLRVLEYSMEERGTALFYGFWGDDLGKNEDFAWLFDSGKNRFGGVVATFSNENEWGEISGLKDLIGTVDSLQKYSAENIPTTAIEKLEKKLSGGGNFGAFSRRNEGYCRKKEEVCEREERTYGATLSGRNLTIIQGRASKGNVMFFPESEEKTIRRRNDKSTRRIILKRGEEEDELSSSMYGGFRSFYYSPKTNQFFFIREIFMNRYYFLGNN